MGLNFDAGNVASPLSVAKHSPIKCGFICLCCRKADMKREKIEEHMCPEHPKNLHKIVKKAVMCEHCDALGDDLEAFNKEPCTVVREQPRPRVGQVPPPPESLAKAPYALDPLLQAKPLEDPRARIQAELDAADREMTKLLLLQSIQRERKELEALLARKSRASTSENTYMNMSCIGLMRC